MSERMSGQLHFLLDMARFPDNSLSHFTENTQHNTTLVPQVLNAALVLQMTLISTSESLIHNFFSPLPPPFSRLPESHDRKTGRVPILIIVPRTDLERLNQQFYLLLLFFFAFGCYVGRRRRSVPKLWKLFPHAK